MGTAAGGLGFGFSTGSATALLTALFVQPGRKSMQQMMMNRPTDVGR
jgi:hypothetical protein